MRKAFASGLNAWQVALGMAVLLGMQAAVCAAENGNGAAGSGGAQAWSFTNLHAAYRIGRDVYLDVSAAKDSKPKTLWDPVSQNFLTSDQIDFAKASMPTIGHDAQWIELPNGNRFKHVIVYSGPRCGYAVGVYYASQAAGETSPKPFYVIERYAPPKKTFYCGVPLRQEFDAALVYGLGLSDGRLMLVDWLRKLAVTLRQPPSSIVYIDDTMLLIPAPMLSAALKADGADQSARYNSLLAVIRKNPGVSVRSDLVR
jgi:hypothetical protein